MATINIYVTFKNKTEGKKIASALLKKKLIACANLFPISSMYWWKGKVKNSTETAALLKAPERNWHTIKNEIQKMHSYDVPCIEKIDSTTTREFNKWVKSTTK